MSAPTPTAPPPHTRTLTSALVGAVVMTLLALVGVGLAMANSPATRTYWIVLAPVYGILCVLTAWYHKGTSSGAVARQALHWLAVATVIGLDFSFIKAGGEETGLASGLNSLLLLALGSLLAGIHLDWPFAVAGALLGLTFIVITLGTEYLPLIFGVGVVAVIVLVVAQRMMQTKAPAPAAAKA
jgi:hypothetical protein